MPAFIGAILLLLGVTLGISGNLPFGENLIKQPSQQAEGFFCIDQIPDREPLLYNIPKPEIDPDWMRAEGCALQACAGDYETANYILATTNVILPEIWPDAQTTRLMKQTNGVPEEYKDRIYRPSCNDWCYLCNDLDELDPACPRSGRLPYGGSFHCDFIWLLQENEPMREINGELYPDDSRCNLQEDPANLEHNCPVFDVLVREGATIPNIAKCNKQQQGASLIKKIFAQGESFIDVLGTRYILVHDPDINPRRMVKWDLRSETEGRVLVIDENNQPLEVEFRGKNYHAYKNLSKKIDVKYKDVFLYLVESWFDDTKGSFIDQVMIADEYPPHQYYAFNYLEFRITGEVKPEAKSLQLGTFIPLTGELRWHWWADESKPAIYLYPPEATYLTVKLNPKGKLTRVDPPYDPETGWQVIAYPDGRIQCSHVTMEQCSNESYPYLFYEAKLEKVYVENEGSVVEGKNLVSFFYQTLPKLGLNEKETADFIDYWMRRLNKNQSYYFIHFLDENQIEELEPLEISVPPDTVIRLRAVFEPLEKAIAVEPQLLKPAPKREGFTLVEWGGILVDY